MARRVNRTYRPAAAHARVLAARQELLSAEEEPMHRYTHTIPPAAPQAVVAAAPACAAGDPAAVTQALEQLACQSQLLVDLLGAVNSLTAAVLCQNGRS